MHGDPQRYRDAFVSIRGIDLRPELGRIRHPAFVAYGRMDRVRLLSHAHELADGIPGSQLIACNSGHCSPLEDPGTIQHALNDLASQIGVLPENRDPPSSDPATRPDLAPGVVPPGPGRLPGRYAAEHAPAPAAIARSPFGARRPG